MEDYGGLVTPEMLARIGVEGEPEFAVDEVCRSEIRRYVVATMDDNPLWYDEEFAKKTKYGPGVAPGSYALRAVNEWHRDMGTPDPNRNLGPDDDGIQSTKPSVRSYPAGVQSFHGGDDVTYIQLPKVGDRISATIQLVEIVEKSGRSGKFIVVYSDKIFKNQHGETLAIHRSSSVARRVKKD